MRISALVVLVATVACQQVPLRQALPEDPVTIAVHQRRSAAVPGSGQALFVRLGDITGGQVMLGIEGPEGQSVVDARSVRYGDVVRFDLSGEEHYLQVLKLHNMLFDNDFAELRLSATLPEPLPPLKAEEEAKQGESG